VRTAAAVYAIAVGVVMVAWWALDLRQGAWDRGDRTRGEMATHLTAEFLAAAWLIVAGTAVLSVGEGAVPFLVAGLGMLLYTVINSVGYFLARRELAAVVMFTGLILLTVAALAVFLL
jgi:hypothetical protein